ncbi:MAG: murein L,D-transpeptidase [Rhizobiaceae bacterium]|nr:murein L,D-transpeptidase [Rhizobiaceae bacterium]
MKSSLLSAAVLVAALGLAGCTEGSLEDIAPKAERALPDKLVTSMRHKGMTRTSAIMLRIFKEEGKLEVWKAKDNGRYDLATSYDICKWSGVLGPKFTEGDRQAPEGFYSVAPHQMNPKSSYHLSFNIGFPNAYDRAHGRTGANLMVHGACSSAGCYSMTDDQVEEIYAFARDAFKGGQTAFQVQAFPFRMTAENMARYRSDPNYEFWKNLKEGYDHFEITKVPPKVDVCGRRYVFNQITADGRGFNPGAACPASSAPDAVASAYQSYQSKYEAAFNTAIETMSASRGKPGQSITGMREAAQVADWSRRRARGEKVTRLPPNLHKEPQVAAAPAPRQEPVAPAAALATPPAATPAPAGVPVAAPVAERGGAAIASVQETQAAAPVPATNPQAAPAPEAEPEKKRNRILNFFRRKSGDDS